MTDPGKATKLGGDRVERPSHEQRVRSGDVQLRQLHRELFGWRGWVGLSRHHQWLVAPCDSTPQCAAILATMISRHPASEMGWLLRTPYSIVLIPGHHRRVPKDAEQVQVVRAGMFSLGRRWQPFEDWFALDGDGVVWANDMGTRALDMMKTDVTVARYAAKVLVAARVTANAT